MTEFPPSGTDLARWCVETHNADEFHKSADPLEFDSRTRVWCALYMDMDYEQGFLFRVYSESDPAPDGRTVETVDHLAVLSRGYDQNDVEWHGEPRLFFDTSNEWVEDACRWFIGWLFDIRNTRSAQWAQENPDTAAWTAKHNRKIEDADRERARALGIHLPYLNT